MRRAPPPEHPEMDELTAAVPAAPWGAVFDVDGTMVDNHPYHQRGWMELGRRRGLPIDADYYKNHIHSRDNSVIMENMRRNFSRADLGQDIAEEKEGIYREIYRPHVAEMPGLLRFLAELRDAGVPCAVASNAPEPNARMVVEELGVAAQFACLLTPAPGLAGKPAPDLFLEAARRMGLPPGRCVVFEDSFSGFHAAEAAGMPCVAILKGASPVSLPHAERAAARHADFTGITREYVEREVLGL